MRKYFFYIFVLGIFFSASLSRDVRAQDDEDIQSWNDLQITVPVTKKVDFYTSVTLRLGNNITWLQDGRYAAGFTWKINKAWSVTPFYWYISARNASAHFRVEHRASLRIDYKFPFKTFGLSHRSTFERRYRAAGDTWRYRPSLKFEKELPKDWITAAKFYINEEPFYDSATKKFSRNRFTVGITKTFTKKFSLDLYYMRQNDGYSHPGDLNVMGTSWKVKF